MQPHKIVQIHTIFMPTILKYYGLHRALYDAGEYATQVFYIHQTKKT